MAATAGMCGTANDLSAGKQHCCISTWAQAIAACMNDWEGFREWNENLGNGVYH